MTDQQIVPGAGPTPVAITLDVAQRLLPKIAFASFDGTGAAGDFLPVVKFVGPGGLVAGQAVGDVVAAGASVDQTWFRGLAKQGGGGSVTSREVLQSNAQTTIPGPGSDYLDWDHQGGSSLLDLTHPKSPKVKAAGVYAVTVTVGVSTLPVGGRYYVQLSATAADFPYVVQASGASVASDPNPWTACTLTVELVKNALLRCYVFNFGAAPHDFGIFPAVVQRIS